MYKNSSSLTSITRLDAWTKAHVKKDEKPFKSQVADTLVGLSFVFCILCFYFIFIVVVI